MRATSTGMTGRGRVREGRGCGYGRRPVRVSRWKRTPRVRGTRVFLPPVTQHVKTRRIRPPGPIARLAHTALAGLGLAAGMASWALVLGLLVF